MIQNNVIVNIEQVIKDFVINCEEMKEILDYRCLQQSRWKKMERKPKYWRLEFIGTFLQPVTEMKL